MMTMMTIVIFINIFIIIIIIISIIIQIQNPKPQPLKSLQVLHSIQAASFCAPQMHIVNQAGTVHTSQVPSFMSHVTHRTSHVTRHTSHVTRHHQRFISCLKLQAFAKRSIVRLMIAGDGCTAHVTRHTSHVNPHPQFLNAAAPSPPSPLLPLPLCP